jgi:hypothetical protein
MCGCVELPGLTLHVPLSLGSLVSLVSPHSLTLSLRESLGRQSSVAQDWRRLGQIMAC